jgi:hypothetical protein
LSIVVVSSLLIAGFFENAAKIQQAIAGTFTSLQSTNNNNNNHNGGTLNVGPPEKITVTEHSKPPVLSPEKRQALQQDQAKTHNSPELPISDQAIKGPKPGTQAQ